MLGPTCPLCATRLSPFRLFFTPAWGQFVCKGCGSVLGVNILWRLGVLLPPTLLAGLFIYSYATRIAPGSFLVMPAFIVLMALVFLLLDQPRVIEAVASRCRKCGYDLRGQSQGRCPECGTEFDLQAARASIQPKPRRWAALTVTVFLFIILTTSLLLGIIVAQQTARRRTATMVVPRLRAADLRTNELTHEMERVYEAAHSCRRDLGHWPSQIDELVGYTLPAGFALSPELTYRPPTEPAADDLDWLLMVSTELNEDDTGAALAAPHRLTLRLNGQVELLPAADVAALLGE